MEKHQSRPGQDLPGFTIVEVFIVIITLMFVYSFIIIAIKPDELKERSRDTVRLADVSKLQAAIEAYIADQGAPPDSTNVTRDSLSAAGTGPLAASNGQGWIGSDLSSYLENLPLDPANVNPLFYRYRHNGLKYEIDTALEDETTLMTEDSGNSTSRYEKGTDLTIL